MKIAVVKLKIDALDFSGSEVIMKRVPINKIKNLTKSNHPLNNKTEIEEAYKIEISEHTVASDTSPYQLKVIIRYGDKTFKKRIKNICRESKIIIDFHQNQENTGSLFNPKYEWVTSVTIKPRILDPVTAFAIEVVVPFAEFLLSNRNAKQLDTLHHGVIYKFPTKEQRDSFKQAILIKLTNYLEEKHQIYEKIN
jgi:hypothetical protein